MISQNKNVERGADASPASLLSSWIFSCDFVKYRGSCSFCTLYHKILLQNSWVIQIVQHACNKDETVIFPKLWSTWSEKEMRRTPNWIRFTIVLAVKFASMVLAVLLDGLHAFHSQFPSGSCSSHFQFLFSVHDFHPKNIKEGQMFLYRTYCSSSMFYTEHIVPRHLSYSLVFPPSKIFPSILFFWWILLINICFYFPAMISESNSSPFSCNQKIIFTGQAHSLLSVSFLP